MVMKTKIVLALVAIMAGCVVGWAQRIEVVDTDGNGISLVSVLTEDGVYIGKTDLNGVLDDVKGATRVGLTHVAYKPQLVTVASLPNGRVTMQDLGYSLGEVVITPKPNLYMEYYFRAFSYIEDSLRAYTAGIIPVAHEIQNNYKGKTSGVWSFGGAANKALTWNTQDLEFYAEKSAKDATSSIEKAIRTGKKFQDYYKVSIEPNGNNRWTVRNPEGVVGNIIHDDGLAIATLDGDKMQIYAYKVNGEKKKAQRREDKNYVYQYTEVFKLEEDGTIQPNGFVMEQNHWEHDTKDGKRITIIYLYAVDKSYMDKNEFKTKRKSLSKGYTGNMSFDELAAYEHAHNIPALAPGQQKAIQGLTKRTGKK